MMISRIFGVLRRRSVVILPCGGVTLSVRYLGDGNIGSVTQNCLKKFLIRLLFYDVHLRDERHVQLLRRLGPVQGHLVWRGEKRLRKYHFVEDFIDIMDESLLLVIFHLSSRLITFLITKQNIFLPRVLNKL